MSTAEEKLAAIAAILNDGAPVVLPTPARWFEPTPEQTAAFAAKVGQPIDVVLGWPGSGPNHAQTKIAPLAAGDIEGAKEYAAHGYRPDGVHYLWTREWLEGQRKFAVSLYDAPTPQAAEARCTNAQSTDPDSLAYQVLTGLVEAPEFTPFRTPECKIAPLADIVAYFQQTMTPGGPGPGIG